MANEDIQAHSGEEPAEPVIKYKRGANKLDEFNWLEGLPYDPRYNEVIEVRFKNCLLYTSPSPRDGLLSRMPSSA